MTRRTALLTATLVAAAAPTRAFARPTIIVDDAIPFTADDLAKAVSIRADSHATIRVDRQGDVLVISVDNQARRVSVDPTIGAHDLARVVALVVVALDASTSETSAPPTPPPPSLPPSSAPIAPPSGVAAGSSRNWTVRFSVGVEQTDWIDSVPAMATLSRRVGPGAHLVVGIGYDQSSLWDRPDDTRVDVVSVPMRAGVEMRFRWLAVEGGLAATRWNDPCWGPTYATGAEAKPRHVGERIPRTGAVSVNRMVTEVAVTLSPVKPFRFLVHAPTKRR
jgi:hypothetical protein